jgi:tRNA (guanine-N7-)-methyltransferase
MLKNWKKITMIKIPADYQQKYDYFMLSTVVAEPLDWQHIFGNDHPVHLEIGSGKGEFISQIALRKPEINFIGIELKHKRIVSILKKLDINKHQNVRIIELFVDGCIREKIREQSIERIYIQHPDPWPKRKHIKNRLIQQELLDCLSYMLTNEGVVELSTDHAGYQRWIIDQFSRRHDFVPNYPEHYSMIADDEHIETYFEAEKRREGYEPCFFQYRKAR